MTAGQNDDSIRLHECLALLGGPGFQGREARDNAVSEMRAVGPDRLFPLLIPMLSDSDPETRCAACEAILWVDRERGVELILPALQDPDVTVRWHACGCLHDFGDERAVESLAAVLRDDADAQVRATAAYALGGIGSPAAIPALLAAIELDHELDIHGHSPSSCAATALDDILGTNETRVRISENLCRVRTDKPDFAHLCQLAKARYQQWSAKQGRTTRSS